MANMTKQDRRYPQRVRNELRFRELTVLRVERIGAGFQRIVLGGEALAGFSSQGFDDHTKVFFPEPGQQFVPPTVTEEGIVWGDGVRPASRDYTPLYDEARHELLAFAAFPSQHWQQIWSTNPLERLKKEIKRRTNVVGTFPNPAALLGLAGHVLIERHDEWDSADRRYFSEHSMRLLDLIPEEVTIPELTAA